MPPRPPERGATGPTVCANISFGSRLLSSVCQYTPLAGRSLPLQEALGVFVVKIAKRPPQALARHGSVIGELDVATRGRIVLGPFGQTRAVGIAGPGEVGPILLH